MNNTKKTTKAGSTVALATGLPGTKPSSRVSQAAAGISTAIDRLRKPLRLTPSGAALFARAKQLLGDADRLYREVRMASDAVLPRFRIGFVDSFAATAGPQLVKSLRDGVEQLLVWSGIASQLRHELIGRDLDLIVSPDPLDGIEGIESRRILQESFIVVLPPNTFARSSPRGFDRTNSGSALRLMRVTPSVFSNHRTG